jgi:hypothetical protein
MLQVRGVALQLLAQLRHVQAQVSRIGYLVGAPDVLQQVLPGHERSGVAGQELEHPPLRRRQVHDLAAADDAGRGQVDLDIAEAHDGVSADAADATPRRREGPQAREQLVDLERLRDVVVGPGIQSLDLVGRARASGDDEDRHVGPPAERGSPRCRRDAAFRGRA